MGIRFYCAGRVELRQAPKSIAAIGGKFAHPDDAQETPDTLQAIYEFDEFSMIWEHAVGIGLGPFQRSHGIAFIGNNGTLVVDRNGWELYPEERLENRRPRSYKMTALPAIEARAVEAPERLEPAPGKRDGKVFRDCARTRWTSIGVPPTECANRSRRFHSLGNGTRFAVPESLLADQPVSPRRAPTGSTRVARRAGA